MPDTVISVEHLSKHYCLGTIGGRTLRDDLAIHVDNLNNG